MIDYKIWLITFSACQGSAASYVSDLLTIYELLFSVRASGRVPRCCCRYSMFSFKPPRTDLFLNRSETQSMHAEARGVSILSELFWALVKQLENNGFFQNRIRDYHQSWGWKLENSKFHFAIKHLVHAANTISENKIHFQIDSCHNWVEEPTLISGLLIQISVLNKTRIIRPLQFFFFFFNTHISINGASDKLLCFEQQFKMNAALGERDKTGLSAPQWMFLHVLHETTLVFNRSIYCKFISN